MSKEKIEEMANFLWENTVIYTEDLCHDVAETLVIAGYRKQSEVAREIFEEIEKCHLHITNEFDVRRYEELKKKYTGEQT